MTQVRGSGVFATRCWAKIDPAREWIVAATSREPHGMVARQASTRETPEYRNDAVT
jgi:hypothetical protein